MPNAVEILFAVGGIRDVQNAIAGIGASLDRLAKTSQQTTERSARARVKAEGDAAKETDRIAKQAARERDRAAREEIRIKNAINALEIRDYQKTEQEKTKAAEREARNRQRAVEKEAREQKRIYENLVRERERMARSFGSAVGGATSRALGVAGRVAGVAAAIGGGFAISDALSAGIQQEKQAGLIFRGATNRGDFQNQKEVQKLAQTTAIATGNTTEDVLGGLDMFVRKTGDLGVARSMLEDMAKLSAATGTNFADMGNTAAEVYNQLNDSKQTMEVMRALAGQGRAGAIDIKDLGLYGGRLAASAAQFTGSLSGNIESFGAIAQLAKKLGGATDTAEATEAVARIGSDVTRHGDKFTGSGISIFSDATHTKLRNAEDIITDAVVKTGGDLGKLHELFGERSIKAVLGAQVAFANAGGGAAGEAAIRKQFADLKATTLSESDIDQGAKERMAELDAKLAVATEKFHAAINEKLLPKLPELIEKFVQLIPSIERFIDFLTSGSAFEGVGKLVGIALAVEIAKAGIGAIVSKGVSAAASGVMGAFSTAVAPTAAAAAGSAGAAGVGGAASALSSVGAAEAAGGGALAGGLALGGSVLGLGAMFYSTLSKHFAKKSAGETAAQALIDQGVGGTDEERAARAGSIQGMISRATAYQDAVKAYQQTGQVTNGAQEKAYLDSEAAGFAKKLGELTAELNTLKTTTAQTTAALSDMAGGTGGRADPGDPVRGGVQ